MARDLEAWGAPKEMVERWREDPSPEFFEIAPPNARAVRLFAASGSQWKFAGMTGVPIGLDYPGVEAAARMLGLDMDADLFERIRWMERAALAATDEGRSR